MLLEKNKKTYTVNSKKKKNTKKIITNKRTEQLDKIEKCIDVKIMNFNANANNTCDCSNLNYVKLPIDIDNIEVLNYNKKKSNKKFNFKKICENYMGLITKSKNIKIIYVIILIFTIILIKKQNLINQLKLMLIKYELFTKILNIKNYIINRNQK